MKKALALIEPLSAESLKKHALSGVKKKQITEMYRNYVPEEHVPTSCTPETTTVHSLSMRQGAISVNGDGYVSTCLPEVE